MIITKISIIITFLSILSTIIIQINGQSESSEEQQQQSFTLYESPKIPPTFELNYDSNSHTLFAQVKLYYETSWQILYTWFFMFKGWETGISNLFSGPFNCTNRRIEDFGLINPPLWSNLFDKYKYYNQTAISGEYLAWPTPSLPWSVTLGYDENDNNIVAYTANFTIDKFLECAGTDNVIKTETEDLFIYHGTFYVVWVQPITPYIPGSPLTAEYSTRSYTFPFAFSVSRNIEDVDVSNPLVPGFIYSYILELEWEYFQATLDGYWYRLHLLLQTKTPSTTNTQGTLTQYHSIQLLSSSIANYGLTLKLNETATDNILECQINSGGYCIQRFSFWSDPILNMSRSDNQTFSIGVLIRTCNQDMSVCTTTNYATSIRASIDLYLQQPEQINIVNQFSSAITYYYNQSFTNLVSRPSNANASQIYFENESVYFKHAVDIAPISNSLYLLFIENVYLCRTLTVPPFLGYDPNYSMYRYGCKYPETLNGQSNIGIDDIFVIITNETKTINIDYGFKMYRPSSFDNTEIGASFSLNPLRSLITNPNNQKFYMDVQSKLFSNDRKVSFLTSSDSSHYRHFELESQNDGSGSNDANDKSLFSFNQIQSLGIINKESSETGINNGGDYSTTRFSTKKQTIIGFTALGVFILIVVIIGSYKIYKNKQQENYKMKNKYGINWEAVSSTSASASQV
jgi:hypothetical protein